MVRIREVAPDVFQCTRKHVNWYLLREGRDLTLIDAGRPGDAASVVASVVAVGCDPRGVAGIVVTHAHTDHLGAVGHFRREYGTPVHLSDADAEAAASGDLRQAAVAELLPALRRPGAPRWALDAWRAGALRRITVRGTIRLPAGEDWEPLDLPGAPVPVATPGHTPGSVCYMLPGGLVATGDALATGHALSRLVGPQLLPGLFTRDEAAAVASLDVLAELDAHVVLPGHGPVWKGSLGEAARIARWRADGVGASLRNR